MNTFTRKALYAAIAGVAAIGVASTAEAVNISADGLGQVLIYPYYTVRNNASGLPYNTLLSVVNTTGSVKAVKVRFREGRNSVEVLDFNVFLSPFDVWTATVSPRRPIICGADPATAGAQISTTDKSCTIPDVHGETACSSSVRFRSPTPATPVSRTAEGYFEIFEMATETGTTAAKATHVNGVPACGITERGRVDRPSSADRRPVRWRDHRQPGGWRCVLASCHGARELQPGPSYQNDRFAVAAIRGRDSGVSNVIQDGTLFSIGLGQRQRCGHRDAARATRSRTSTFSTRGTKSQTSWIITMPTKYAYVNAGGPLPAVHLEVHHARRRVRTDVRGRVQPRGSLAADRRPR